MRPTTASKNKPSRPAAGTAKEAGSPYETSDMMISGKELGSHMVASGTIGQSLSNGNLPRYKSTKMGRSNAEDGKEEGNNAGKVARAGGKDGSSARGLNAGAETPKGSTSKHASQKHPQFGVHGTSTSSKKDSANSQSTAHQPRQKRQSLSRQGSNAKSSHTSGPTGSYGGFGVRNAQRSKDAGSSGVDISKKQEEYGVSGMGFTKFGKSNMRNNDICDELILSKEGMRFDQRQKDAENAKKDELMREAEEALADTESVLKTRKDALMARHVEGRESLHELDYIFQRNKDSNAG